MKLRLSFIGASLAVAASALAVSYTSDSFPGMSPAKATPEGARTSMHAPLNPNKDKGTPIFGYTTWDFNGVKHYLTLFSKSPMYLNKLNDILIPGISYDDDYPRMLGTVAGSWGGDGYYAYRMVYYTFETRLQNWVKVDPKTGVSQELYSWNTTGAVDPSWWSTPQATLWNPNEPDEMYALAQNTDGTITSVLHKIDKSTGQFVQKVATLGKYYFAAAFDYDNQLYALSWKYNNKGVINGAIIDILDPEDNYEIISSKEILVDGKPWEIYYENNLAFDYTTGELWWAAIRITNMPSQPDVEFIPQDQKRLIKIDPLTLETENMGGFGVDESIGGMYIDYVTADNRRAPARPTNEGFRTDNGNNNVILTWNNPTTFWNRRSMNNLSSVEIYRDSYPGTPVGQVSATGKEGAAMEWTDMNAPAGVHTYYIVAVNDKGKGVPCELEAFVGKDLPGPVTNLQASTTDGKSIHLEWEKPARGDSDGWFDDSDLSYTITRLPDNVDLGTVKDTMFDDNTIGEAQLFSYRIVASNNEGNGTPIESNAVYAGSGIRPPYSTNFETRVEADRFSYLDKNGDGIYFVYDNNNHLLRNTYKIILSNHSNDDVLVSPPLLVEKGKTYKVTYDVYLGGFGQNSYNDAIPTPVRLLGGTEPTVDGMNQILVDDSDHLSSFPANIEKYTVYFSAPVDGEYYIGYETLIADEDDLWIYIEGFAIEEAPADDLEALTPDCYLYLSAVEPNAINVNVYNNGDNPQSKYTVQLAVLDGNGKPQVFAETSDVPEIKAHETATIKFNEKMPSLGELKLVAVVDLPGDANTDNNVSDPVIVQSDEALALNFTVNDPDSETHITNVPFNHFYACTASQTIYTPAMTLLDRIYPNQTPVITRIAWEGTSINNITPFEDTEIAVFMSQTDKDGYSTNSPEFLPVTGEPLFNDIVPFKAGRNYVVADFGEGFPFDPTQALVVTVLKEDQKHGDWMFEWRTFDADWYADKLHTVYCGSIKPVDLNNPTGQLNCFADAPVIHLAIKGDAAGIGHLVMTGNSALLYNPNTSSVESAGFPIASVEVYNQAGQLMQRVNGNGEESVRINRMKGLYLIKVNGVAGKSLSLKAIL